ncbi:Methyltransferase domain [Dillenia turbinata]|uniref:Small RNA 2'-O-methyltransferase n=1 Tax=Dillenia turbinata TaxID=194707 RepID=A0AAN8VM70_9MAGN
MDTKGSSGNVVKKATLTPKAIIHQKFGTSACYKVEEVQESQPNGCPGLAIPMKSPSLFRCTLHLPDCTVRSGTFKRKKDAEQSAAEKALEKLGINLAEKEPTVDEAQADLIARISHFFSVEFLLSPHPLSGHLRSALRREDGFKGQVPVSVIAVGDARVNNLSRCINPKVESNPYLAIPLIMDAATKLSGLVATSEGRFSLQRKGLYPQEVMRKMLNEAGLQGNIEINTIHIPFSLEKPIHPLTLNVSASGYYLDVIAQKLGVEDAARVLTSRAIGKASSEIRLYFSAPLSSLLSWATDMVDQDAMDSEGLFNARASYLSGQLVVGDAILASVGYTWRSTELCYEHLSAQAYYRMFISKTPSGLYKLSREATLAAELPLAFTARTNWRGTYPRDLLYMFCSQHRLSEPVFVTSAYHLESFSEVPKKMKMTQFTKEETGYPNGGGSAASGGKSSVSEDTTSFRCEIKIFSKSQDLILEYHPKDLYKKQGDAIQSASLKVLLWLDRYLREPDLLLQKINSSADDFRNPFCHQNFTNEFSLCNFIHKITKRSENKLHEGVDFNFVGQLDFEEGHEAFSLILEGQSSGVSASSGSLACIGYSISLVMEGENMKELVESSEEFEFEMGTGAVIPILEACVMQMSVGQYARFNTQLPADELVLAAVKKPENILSLACTKVEYSVILLRVTEPMEDRMEQALFSPPLSKQRMDFAGQLIRESCVKTLVDFGCGSGTFLESLFDYQTTLERIVGVDISQKSLSRAAKILHSKLDVNSKFLMPSPGLESAVLYNGSITDFDSRLYGSDIGTCLEVIEHMEEDQACLFGDVVLSSYCLKTLIVSTPNYEYNVILRRMQSQEDDPDEKTQLPAYKFRNQDHKFEWTRGQFNNWASDLAARHNYSVEFSGVGGSGDESEPGFASQIAVFRRKELVNGDSCAKPVESLNYKLIWEWNSNNSS